MKTRLKLNEIKQTQKMYQELTTTKQEEKTKHDKYHGKKSMKTRFKLNEIKQIQKMYQEFTTTKQEEKQNTINTMEKNQ